MANLGQDNFNARIKRIKSPGNTSYYDPDLKMHIPKKTSQQEIRKNVKARKFSIMKVLACLIIGVVAMMIAQGVRLQYLQMIDASNASLFVDVLLALFCMLLISALLRYRKLWHRFFQFTGAALMFIAGHNLMWAYPNELAIIYTSEYVTQVREQTQPMSLIFRDITISL